MIRMVSIRALSDDTRKVWQKHWLGIWLVSEFWEPEH